jgi:hypothetical protein
LFDLLLADGALRNAWATARARAPRCRIRLRIDPDATELHTLPWELLHDELSMLSAHADTPFSRYLPIALPWSGAVVGRPVRVLVVIADPVNLQADLGLDPVDVAAERALLETVFDAAGPGELQADFLEAPATLTRLEDAIRQGYHALYFVGHGVFSAGRGQAAIYMQDDAGNAARVLDSDLVNMIARQGVRPHLVFLSACQSATRSTADALLGLAPKLVTVGVPVVVAMQDVVTVETARKFGATFFQRLLEHGRADQAVNQARSAMLTTGRTDAAVPVLFMRLKSGQLWGDEVDVRGEVLGVGNTVIFWSGLMRMIETGRCTPIIGPRARSQWLPTPGDVAGIWASTHDYPLTDKDNLARVAQFMASSMGEDFPRAEMTDLLVQTFKSRLPAELVQSIGGATLTELVTAVGWQQLTADDPNDVHMVLASLDLPLYLTTNPDSLMCEALAAQDKRPIREVCRWNELLDALPSPFESDPDYRPAPEAPLVYHLFGSDAEPDSLVLTEDNYLDLLVRISSDINRVPPYVWASLANSSLIFLGFSPDDWEFRVIMRGLVATREQRRRFKHVGVQLEPDHIPKGKLGAVQTFLQQYFESAEINVYWGSVQQFAAELREHREKAGS